MSGTSRLITFEKTVQKYFIFFFLYIKFEDLVYLIISNIIYILILLICIILNIDAES